MQEQGGAEHDSVGKLFAGDILLGYVRVTHVDQPLVYYDFEPAVGFRPYEQLFRRERELAKSARRDEACHEERGEVVRQMEGMDLRIVECDGSEAKLQRIIIDGPKARCRVGFLRSFVAGRPGGGR